MTSAVDGRRVGPLLEGDMPPRDADKPVHLRRLMEWLIEQGTLTDAAVGAG